MIFQKLSMGALFAALFAGCASAEPLNISVIFPSAQALGNVERVRILVLEGKLDCTLGSAVVSGARVIRDELLCGDRFRSVGADLEQGAYTLAVQASQPGSPNPIVFFGCRTVDLPIEGNESIEIQMSLDLKANMTKSSSSASAPACP